VGDALEAGIASLKAQRAYFENLGREFDAEAFLREGAARVGQRLGCSYAVDFRVFQL
jgi:hypothetical protein